MNNSDAVIVNVTLDLGELSSQYKNLTDGIKDLYTVFHTNCAIYGELIKSAIHDNTVIITDCNNLLSEQLQIMQSTIDGIQTELESSTSDTIWNAFNPFYTSLVDGIIKGFLFDKTKKGKYQSEPSSVMGDIISTISNLWTDETGSINLGAISNGPLDGLLDMAAAWDMTTIAQAASTAATTAWSAVCSAATAVTSAFGAAVTFLTSPIGLIIIGITALIAIIVLLVANWDTVKATIITGWEAIKTALATAGEWVNTTIIQPLIAHFAVFWEWLRNAFMVFSNFLANVFAVDWTEHFGAFGNVLNAFFANVENIWNAIKEIFNGVINFVKSVFAGDWEAVWNSIVDIFGGIWDGIVAYLKIPINGVIGLINSMIQGIVDGFNSVVDTLNGLRFTIPSWIPKIGGNSFSLNLSRLSAYQIPYLAQGAVLPANRPFLAVVGDQKHGTNVEAPLSTIQAAVAEVMARQGTGDINITFTGDLAQLGRVLKPVIERENRRVGGSLAKGVY